MKYTEIRVFKNETDKSTYYESDEIDTEMDACFLDEFTYCIDHWPMINIVL